MFSIFLQLGGRVFLHHGGGYFLLNTPICHHGSKGRVGKSEVRKELADAIGWRQPPPFLELHPEMVQWTVLAKLPS